MARLTHKADKTDLGGRLEFISPPIGILVRLVGPPSNGWTNPILIDEDGNGIAGHCRLEEAKRMGVEEVPTICLAHMTAAQKRAYIIAGIV